VDEVFIEESLELKRDYIEKYSADVLVMGDDWAGKFDEFEDICEVVYLTRTPAISTTALIEKISGTV
jgi:glycerol-3-phosphate cytidylyltransferase